ncbi:MAG: hypothetical protein H7838_02955 [Magnetococcus sp. DMHC-8]
MPASATAQEQGAVGDRPTMLERFGPAARQGDAVAQTNLGAIYLHGVGVRRNPAKAHYWFRQAAEQGEGLAQFNMGVLCQEGQGTPRDDQKAVDWFRRVVAQPARIDQLHPVIKGWAQLKLGFIYYEGRGVARDYQEALTWFRLAAERGIVMAQEMVGQLYAQGQGTARDEKRAFFWYEHAARQGSRVAEKALPELSKKLTLAQQAEARTLETPPPVNAGTQPPTGLPAQLTEAGAPGGVPLTVAAKPADAQVRILNIRPRYTPGMRLEPGLYHLEITRAGYRPEKLWVTVQESDVKVDVTLTPEGAPVVAQANAPATQSVKPAAATAEQPDTSVPVKAAVAPGARSEVVATPGGQQTAASPPPVADGRPGGAAQHPVGSAATQRVERSSAPLPPPAPVAGGAATATAQSAGSTAPSATQHQAEARQPPHARHAAPPTGEGRARHALTVQAEPAEARIKVLDIAPPYQPGMLLKPGSYRLEVSHPGFQTRRLRITMGDTDLQVPVALLKETDRSTTAPVATRAPVHRAARPPATAGEPMEACPVAKQPNADRPRQYALTVQSDPGDAHVRIMNSRVSYQPGVSLAPGRYHLAIAKESFKTRQCWAEVVDRDLDLDVALQPVAPGDLHALTIRPQPADALVRLLNIRTPYRAGMLLESGSYRVEVSKKGYKTEQRIVELGSKDLTVPIHLKELPLEVRPTLTVVPVLQGVEIRIVNANVPYRPGVPLAPGRYLLELSKPGFKTQQRWVELSEQDVKVEVPMEASGARGP